MHPRFSVALLLLQSILAIACAGRDVTPQVQFERLIHQLNQLNRHDPAAAASASAPAVALAGKHDPIRNRILLDAALAPSDSIRRGYQNARYKLTELLGPAMKSDAAHELVPVLRLAIADLAQRHGEVRYGFYQLLDALDWINKDTPDEIRVRLLDLVARLNQSARLPFAAMESLEQMAKLSKSDPVMGPSESKLRKAELLLDAGQYGPLKDLLAGIPSRFDPHTDPRLVAEYWLMHGWYSLATSQPSQTRDYLQQAEKVLQEGPSPRVSAELQVLAAVLAAINGAPESVVDSSLQAAGNSFAAAGIPGRFAELLIRIVHTRGDRQIRDVPPAILRALARFAHAEENLLRYSEGLAAWAELLRREGKIHEALHKQQQSTLRLGQFRAGMDTFQTEWGRRSGEVLFLIYPLWEVSVFYYILLTLSILAVVLLLLSLKIRTQRHVNRQLAESVEKARYAEQAAQASSRLKSHFLANVSHELKTPMSGVVGMASLLEELVSDPVQRKYLSTIRTCSENLLVLMNDLLDLGRMESGVVEVEVRGFSPVATIDYSMDVVRGKAAKKGLKLQSEIAPGMPETLIGDPTRIGQVLTNLLDNAIKFTASGSVTLRAGYERTIGAAGTLTVAIEDTGMGIFPDSLHTLFEPFNRVRAEGGRDLDGSGLGLAICKKLVELMGGSISARSRPDQGSCFTVILPVKTSLISSSTGR